jgi:purine-binding chemotaxis protein CheW
VTSIEIDRALLVFRAEGQRYALRLGSVVRVLRMMEIVALPSAPDIVLGVIDIAGSIVPVMDLRARLRLPLRQASPSDVLVLAHGGARRVALAADEVVGVVECPADLVPTDALVPGIEHVSGVLQLGDGLVLIHDLDTFLSLDEARRVDRALHERAASTR